MILISSIKLLNKVFLKIGRMVKRYYEISCFLVILDLLKIKNFVVFICIIVFIRIWFFFLSLVVKSDLFIFKFMFIYSNYDGIK